MEPTIESFRWTVPGDPERILRGRVVRPGVAGGSASWPHVVIVHGFKGFMDWGFFPELARRFAGRGLAAVLVNLSGSGIGENPEEFTEVEAFAADTISRELEDLEVLRAGIRAGRLAALDPDRSAILGHSRGGGAALVHASEDGGYRAVVTWAAIDDFDRFDETTRKAWREEGQIWVPNARTGQPHRMDLGFLEDLEQNRSRLDPVAACRHLEAPLLLVHGTADESVPVAAAERLAAAAGTKTPLELLTLEGAGHTFGVGHPFGGSTPAWEQAVEASLDHVERHVGWPGRSG